MSNYIAERLVRNRMKRLHEAEAPIGYAKKIEKILNHRLGSYETGVTVDDVEVLSETPGTITVKVDYSVDIKLPMYDPEDQRTYYETDQEYRTQTMTLDFDELDENSGANLGDEITYRGKSYTIIRQRGDSCVLRPTDKVDDDSFEGKGDSFDDIYLDKYQLKKHMREDLTLDDDPEETEQKYSSAATSINSAKLPALFNMVDFEEGSINLDYGGGRFDNVAEYLEKEYGATNLVYDKYNRSADHNREVLNVIRKNGGADTVTCSNVLNVIAEESERLAVLRNCKRYLKAGGTCYITVYEGSGTGEGAPTKAGFQLNRKTKDYEAEIKQVFSSVTRKGKLFICR